MLKICFLDEYSVNGADLSAIRACGEYTGYEDTPPAQVMERCKGRDVVITNKVRIGRDEMRQLLPELKLICVAATGMNNIDLDAAEELGITVKNAVNYSTYSVAEATLAGVLALVRQTVYYDAYVKSGDYARSPRLFHFGPAITGIHGKRWGIVGMGHIGRQVAALAAAFGAEIAYHSTSGNNTQAGYTHLPLEELLRTSDIVSLHAPLSPATANLLGEAQFRMMKPTAIVANMARGGMVDEAALTRALNEGRIAGAVVDVFTREPINADNPLCTVAEKHRLVLSPHTAWISVDSINRLVGCIADNILTHFTL